jgi:hypothetical protein
MKQSLERAARLMRARVNDRLARAARYPITVIAAPAGFGKSVALRDFVETARIDAVRYDVLREDGTLLAFVRGLSEALAPVAASAKAAYPAMQQRVLALEDPLRHLRCPERLPSQNSTRRCRRGRALDRRRDWGAESEREARRRRNTMKRIDNEWVGRRYVRLRRDVVVGIHDEVDGVEDSIHGRVEPAARQEWVPGETARLALKATATNA